jgi:hypothetical protein
MYTRIDTPASLSLSSLHSILLLPPLPPLSSLIRATPRYIHAILNSRIRSLALDAVPASGVVSSTSLLGDPPYRRRPTT